MLIGVITLQIVSRVFFQAVGWTEEAARFLLAWTTFLGASTLRARGTLLLVVTQQMFQGINSFTLVAVPCSSSPAI